MHKNFFEYDDKLWIVHRSIPDSQMTPRAHGINSDDINKMVRVWVEWLRDNCIDIQKVYNKDGKFLFCELVQDAEILSSRANGWGKAAQFGGTFVGAMIDPINIVPVGFGASLLGKSLAIGIGNALLDTAIYAPLAESTEEHVKALVKF